jgi:hypothetical protein
MRSSANEIAAANARGEAAPVFRSEVVGRPGRSVLSFGGGAQLRFR